MSSIARISGDSYIGSLIRLRLELEASEMDPSLIILFVVLTRGFLSPKEFDTCSGACGA